MSLDMSISARVEQLAAYEQRIKDENQRRLNVAYDRLTARLDQAAAETLLQLQAERAAWLAAHDWPEGCKIVVYRIIWVVGIDNEGEPVERQYYVTSDRPLSGPHPTVWHRITGRGKSSLTLVMPNGYEIEPVTWASLADLPYEFRRHGQTFFRVLVDSEPYIPVKIKDGELADCEEPIEVSSSRTVQAECAYAMPDGLAAWVRS